VTGGCGLIGRAILRKCEGVHDTVVLDRSSNAAEHGGVQGDITDLDVVLDAASGCDAIIHTAALHGGNLKTATTADFIRTNVGGSDNIFQAALRHRIRRVVVASSMEVLVGLDWNASGMTVLDELSPLRPDWIYPVTKQQIEALGSFYSRIHHLEVAQLRYVAIENKPILQLGYELLTRVITPSDAASATIAAVETEGIRDETFMIGPSTPLGQRDINDAMAGRQWDVLERHWPGSKSVLADRVGTPHTDHFWPVTRTDKAALMLNWRPRDTFEAYLHLLGWQPPAKVSVWTPNRSRERKAVQL
jgi:nucleoside-diphosphate-sugar epimerase